jgi:hypothetical protein
MLSVPGRKRNPLHPCGCIARHAPPFAQRTLGHGPDQLTRPIGHDLGEESAVTILYSALDVMDPTFVRARAGLHADLAHAHLTRAEYDDANTHLRQARQLASRTGSVRQRRRVALLTERL